MKKIFLLMLVCVLLFNVAPAFAQGEPPHIVNTTRPISAELRGWLNDWLAVDAPSDAPYYIVTNTSDRGEYVIVSLVGVYLNSPDSEWSLEEDPAEWMGSVKVFDDGQVFPFRLAVKAPGLMLLRAAAGGGSYVAFPFVQGSAAQYGPRGVHGEGDYGTSGMFFVDLVSGSDMGATAATPDVYASDAGEIDYVCDDGVTVAVRTFNETTGDYFLYAHLLDNENLAVENTFTQGELIGSLKYGSFDGGSPSCGWAEQHANHYHVHWGFVPASGKYQVGSCILTLSTQVWACGDKTVKVGGFLEGGGGFGTAGNSSGTSGAGTTVSDPTFFDYIISGIVGLVGKSLFDLLPTHQPFQYTYMLFNAVELFFRLVYVFFQSNISLRFVFIVILLGFAFKALTMILWFGAFILKAWKSLVPIFGA